MSLPQTIQLTTDTGPGFVASHLADLLIKKKEVVWVTYRWTDNRDSFKHIMDDVNSRIALIDEVVNEFRAIGVNQDIKDVVLNGYAVVFLSD